MKKNSTGILILGASGAGKTTLGKLVAQRLGFGFIDIDDYIWRWDTAVPYTVMNTKDDKIRLLNDAVSGMERFVMAGSMNSFHEYFDSLFELAVHLNADKELRLSRLHEREFGKFGARILAGGDMYELHRQFLKEAAGYDYDLIGATMHTHRIWMDCLKCPILRLDGGDSPEMNADTVISAYKNLQKFN